MANIISIINMKGGVGKTTLSLGLSIKLSEKYSVLLIDVDPQFNATQAMLNKYKNKNYDEESKNFYTEEIIKNEKTIYKLFKPMVNLDNDTSDIFPSEELIVNMKKNLDLICGDLNLVLVNKSSDYSHLRKLKFFIENNKLNEKYDFIFIDCPPTLTIYTEAALLASNYYLIPNQIDMYSIIGIQSLQRAVKGLAQERTSLRCLGLIYTRVNKSMYAKEIKIKEDFESKKIMETIDIFSSKITESKNLRYGRKGPIPTEYKETKEDIESICGELEEKIERGK